MNSTTSSQSNNKGNTLADLTASTRRTTGNRPPPLVGCSITLLRNSIYVFGGRLVTSRIMISDLYELNLNTLIWTKLSPSFASSSSTNSTSLDQDNNSNIGEINPTSTGPSSRYFHSVEAWNDSLVLFGGEGYSSTPTSSPTSNSTSSTTNDSSNPPPLKTLGDLWIYNTISNEWSNPNLTCSEGIIKPEPRYAHLTVINSWTEVENEGEVNEREVERSNLIVIGGQDLSNSYLHSVNVLDLDLMRWIKVGKWEKHVGTYRAILTSAEYGIIPSRGIERGQGQEFTAGEENELVQLSYSKKPTSKDPCPLFIYSNFNFTQVRRDLDLISAPTSPSYSLGATSLSSHMSPETSSLPPGLRFPTSTVIGSHLLLFGTYLSPEVNNFSIWALDLGKRTGLNEKGILESIEEGGKLDWRRIDPGEVLSKGSWNRAVGGWKNSVVVLGDRERSITSDYNHRQINFTHVSIIDLEAYGIYQPPIQLLSQPAQALGLLSLSQPFVSDFEIICSRDGKRLGCSRKVLEERWSWFRDLMNNHIDSKLGDDNSSIKPSTHNSIPITDLSTPNQQSEPSPSSSHSTPFHKLTSRILYLPESASTVLSFLQYLYTFSLCTSLQLSLPILCSLLLFSKTYDLDHLRSLVVHALHEALDNDDTEESVSIAAKVYNVAGLGGATALQIRALRLMMVRPRNISNSNITHQDRNGSDPNSISSNVDDSRSYSSSTSDSKLPPPPPPAKSNRRPSSRNGNNEFTNQRNYINTKEKSNKYSPIQIPPSPQSTRIPLTIITTSSSNVSPYPKPNEPLPLLPTARSSSITPDSGGIYLNSDIDSYYSSSRNFPLPPPSTKSPTFPRNQDLYYLEENTKSLPDDSFRDSITIGTTSRRIHSSIRKRSEDSGNRGNISRALSPVAERKSEDITELGYRLQSRSSGLGLLDMDYDVRMLQLDGRFGSTGRRDSIDIPDQSVNEFGQGQSYSTYTSPTHSPLTSYPPITAEYDSRKYTPFNGKVQNSSRGTSTTSGGMSSSYSSMEIGTNQSRTRNSSFSSLGTSPDFSPPSFKFEPIQPISLNTEESFSTLPLPILPIPVPKEKVEILLPNLGSNSSKKSNFSFMKKKSKTDSTTKANKVKAAKLLDEDRPILIFDSRSPTGITIIRPTPKSPLLEPTLNSTATTTSNSSTVSSPRQSITATSISSHSTTYSSSELSPTSWKSFLPPPPNTTSNSEGSNSIYNNYSATQSTKSFSSSIFKKSKGRSKSKPESIPDVPEIEAKVWGLSAAELSFSQRERGL